MADHNNIQQNQTRSKIPSVVTIDSNNSLLSLSDNDQNNNNSTNNTNSNICSAVRPPDRENQNDVSVDAATSLNSPRGLDDIFGNVMDGNNDNNNNPRSINTDMVDEKEERYDWQSPPVLPTGQVIDAKNTLQSFDNMGAFHSNNANTNYLHHQTPIPSLPTGEDITAKNTLQSFGNFDNVALRRREIYPENDDGSNNYTDHFMNSTCQTSPNFSASESQNRVNENTNQTVHAVPIFDDDGSNNVTPALNARLVLFQNSISNDQIPVDPDVATNCSAISTKYIIKWTIASCLFLLLIICEIALFTGTVPTPIATYEITPDLDESTLTEFINNITLSDQIVTTNGNSPESKALQWLLEDNPILLQPISFSPYQTLTLNSITMNELSFRIRQRYTLVTLWFQQPSVEPTWLNVSNWLQDPNECNWYGVICYDYLNLNGVGSKYPFVVQALNFYNDEFSLTDNSINGDGENFVGGNNVVGALSSDLGLLQHLQRIDFRSNSFTGSLPESIGLLTKLTYFAISSNAFNGTLPESIGHWNSIEYINFQDNLLTGTLPNAICNSTTLIELSVDCEIKCDCCRECN